MEARRGSPADTCAGPDLGDVPYQSAFISGKEPIWHQQQPTGGICVKPKQRVRFHGHVAHWLHLDGHRMTGSGWMHASAQRSADGGLHVHEPARETMAVADPAAKRVAR